MEKDLRNPQESLSLVGFVFFFGRKNKKKKSDLFSPSLSFDLIREKEISDIHTEKFHPPKRERKLKW